MMKSLKAEKSTYYIKEQARLFLYSRTQNGISFLLYSPDGDDRQYSCMGTNITEFDITAQSALARKLMEEFGGLFTKNRNDEIKPKIYTGDERILIYNEDSYHEYLQLLLEDSIQYEFQKTSILFFKEIPYSDYSKFAKPKLEYFSLDEIEFKNKVEKETVDILTDLISKNFLSKLESPKAEPEYATHLLVFLIDTDDTTFRSSIGAIQLFPLFVGNYKREGDVWKFVTPDLARISKSKISELPYDHNALMKLKYVILPGGASGVYEDKQFLRDTEEWLLHVYHKYPHVKFLGNCLGHQIIAQSFGGLVERDRNRQFFQCFEEIKISHSILLNRLGIGSMTYDFKEEAFMAMECHGDQVYEIDSSMFDCLGHSKSSDHEIVISKDNRILTTQFHPEFEVEGFAFREASEYYKNYFSSDFSKAIERKNQTRENYENSLKKSNYKSSQAFFRELCYIFLHIK